MIPWQTVVDTDEQRELAVVLQRLEGGAGAAGAETGASTAAELASSACAGLGHLRGIADLSPEQATALLALGRALKLSARGAPQAHRHLLAGRTLAALFEKPSLRTRCTFEAGMFQLGGCTITLTAQEIGLGTREPARDVARNLCRWTDGIAARVFSHGTIQEMAAASCAPVINALCDQEHPCQALADMLTLWERHGRLSGLTVAFVGDGNNVANSLLLLGTLLGMQMRFAGPPEHGPHPAKLAAMQGNARRSGGSIEVFTDAVEAVSGADAVYTDVWTSMGQESERAQREQRFRPYQVNEGLMKHAAPGAVFLHCLPAHRGEEVSEEVFEAGFSAVFDQAENRLHAQKAVLAVLLNRGRSNR